MKLINAAVFTKYNANNRGNNTGDCVKRSLSIAFDIDYNAVSKELLQIMHEKHRDSWKTKTIFEKFISNHGGGDCISCWRDGLQVDDWIDQHPEGTYLLLTGPKPDSISSNHLTCAIDGRLIDSWNSLGQYVKEYYVVEGRAALEISDIQSHFDELGQRGKDLLLTLIVKYAQKYKLDTFIRWAIREPRYDGFSIKIPVSIYIDKFDKPSYHFKIAYVFTPTTTLDEAKKKVDEISKIRMYDRFYAINADVKGKQEAEDLYSQSSEKNDKAELYFWDYETERAYNSLPHWCKPFVTRIWVQSPGQYSDSYQLKMIALPGDPNRNRVEFWAYNADELKQELAMYKKDFSRPGVDYDPYEMF